MPLAPPDGTRHRTKQEFVYRTIRDAIMTCELRPGERLVIDDLGRRLKVSAIPVREALQLLQSEGLVVSVPHVGATVAPISRESMQDVFAVLEGLEIVAARLATERATPEDEEALAQIVAEMDRDVAAGAFDGWAEANRRFHLAISALAGLPMLREMSERVLDRWDRVRRYFFTGVLVPRVKQAQREHRQILAAIRARDLAAVQEIVQRHNQNALASYMAFLNGGEAIAAPSRRAAGPRAG